MYKALYRRFRPARFDEVMGQEHVTLTLKNEVINNKVSHAYLFTGSRGVGKTTTAKILAKALNCSAPKDGEPCGACDLCKGIDDGTVPDVCEIDAASSTGVDNIRALREDAQFAPVMGKRRVYIIDEVHMLSIGAFNALLKIMEEPPESVVFVLATTQANKIPATVLSRCQRFNFLRPDVLTIEKLLLKVASEAEIAIDSDAARLISILADGGMRDALSLLDVCGSISDGKVIDEALVESVAAVPLDERCLELLEAIVDKELEKSLKIVNDCYARAIGILPMCEALLRNCRNILLLKLCKTELDLLEIIPKNLKRTQELALKITKEQTLCLLEKLKRAYEETARSGAQRLEMELCIVDLCSGRAEESEAGQNKPDKDDLMQRVEKWPQVIDRLFEINKVLAGALKESCAYIDDDRLLVDSQNSIFLELIRNNVEAKQALKGAIADVLGRRYKIGPYRKT